MALPTGSGTETLHTHTFEDVDATQSLIVGCSTSCLYGIKRNCILCCITCNS